MRALGHQPVPFRQFILKIHSRCNLSCTYCYVYEMADRGWPDLPKRMDPAIARPSSNGSPSTPGSTICPAST